jgi:hypothetical protein
MADSTPKPWSVEDVDDGPGGIRHPQPSLATPLRLHAPFHRGRPDVGHQVAVIEQPDGGGADPFGCLQDGRVEYLVGEGPMVRCRPSGEVARIPHLGGDDQGILGPRCWVGRINWNRDVQPTPDPAKPALCSPARQLLRCRLCIDAQYVDDVVGGYEPPAGVYPLLKRCIPDQIQFDEWGEKWGSRPDWTRQCMSWTNFSETAKRAAAACRPDSVRHVSELGQLH